MKKFIVLINLIIFLALTVITYNSCNSISTAQAYDSTSYSYSDTTAKSNFSADTTVVYLFDESSSLDSPPAALLNASNDSFVKRAIIKKDIKPIEIDTEKKFKRDSMFRQLEKTEKQIKSQQKIIDSLLIIKKK